MNATIRNVILAALPVASFGSGCLHNFAPRHAATGTLHCAVRPGETSCVESSRFDDAGMLRHHVVERTTPGDRCDLVTVEQASFDATGVLIQRVIEDRRCRVVDRRVSTEYDLVAGVVEHRAQFDEDHDGALDTDEVTRMAMTRQIRALAQTTGRARMAHIAASVAAQRGGQGSPTDAGPALVTTIGS